jgi:peptidoglycan/LPS O-acetylase OafA/YrhL
MFWSGYEAVIFFFVLSGFVLAIPFLDAIKPTNYAVYLTKRIFRIYPPYAVAVCMAVLANICFYRGAGIPELSGWFNHSWQGRIDWKLVTSHFFLIGSFENWRFNPVIWSLVIEMRISILFPAIIWLVQKYNYKISLLLAFVTGFSYWVITRLKVHGHINYQNDYFDTLKYVGFFILGGVLAKHRLTLAKIFQGFCRPWKFFFLAASVLAYTNNWWLYRSGLLDGTRWQNMAGNFFFQDIGIGLGVAGFIIIGLFSRCAGDLLNRRPLVLLGKISYSLYLYHVINTRLSVLTRFGALISVGS